MAIQTPAGCLATNAAVCFVFSAALAAAFRVFSAAALIPFAAACPCRLCILLFYLLFSARNGKGDCL